MIANRELMLSARTTLRGRWKMAVGAGFIYLLILGVTGAIPVVGSIIGLIIGGPMTVGLYSFFLAMVRKDPAVKVERMFSGFALFMNAFIGYILMILFVLLWALLLIVPGIMASFSYALTFLILADNPSMSGLDAIKASKKMMYGHRWRLFCLICRFLGWLLLCIVTLGVALLWVWPYMVTSSVLFYEDLKTQTVTTPQAA
jgi:uncharacterized membrane protein